MRRRRRRCAAAIEVLDCCLLLSASCVNLCLVHVSAQHDELPPNSPRVWCAHPPAGHGPEPPTHVFFTWAQNASDEYAAAHPPWPILGATDVESASIFLGLSSYRDERCSRTLVNAFSRAHNRARVFAGVVDQRRPSDSDGDSCLARFCEQMRALFPREGVTAGHGTLNCPWGAHVRQFVADAQLSQGPTLARHWQQRLIRDETFCLQTDAHSAFVHDWDTKLIREWAEAENEFAVLTTYVHDMQRVDEAEKYPLHARAMDVPYICRTTFAGITGDIVRNEQACAAGDLTRPKLGWTWGAGLSFSKCHAERAVPYDPHLPHIFDGEEFSRALRLFSHGYDVYAPSRNFVFHDYTPVPHHWSQDVAPRQQNVIEAERTGAARLRALFGMADAAVPYADLAPYDLGRCRSRDAFYAWSTVDPTRQTASAADTANCGTLRWQPWSDACARRYESRATKQWHAAYPMEMRVNFSSLPRELDDSLQSWLIDFRSMHGRALDGDRPADDDTAGNAEASDFAPRNRTRLRRAISVHDVHEAGQQMMNDMVFTFDAVCVLLLVAAVLCVTCRRRRTQMLRSAARAKKTDDGGA